MGASRFVVLLPPSEGKATGGDPHVPWRPESGVFAGALGAYRHDIAVALKRIKGGNEKMLGVKGVHLAHATSTNRSLVGSPTLPAWQRYTGVVWDHLDLGSVPSATRRGVVSRIFVPSGLAGLVRADDPLPDYRLKMGARLAPFGTISSWWRDDLTDAFVDVVGSTLVVDLLPQEHRAAFDWLRLPSVVRVDLVSKKGGVVGGHNAKAAKGLLARHLLLGKTTSVTSLLESFSHHEYSAKATQ